MPASTKSRSEFGTLLRQYRVEAGLSQENLAERASMSVDGISALERGTNQAPQRETLALLVRALGLDDDRQRTLESVAVRTSRPRRRAILVAHPQNLPKIATCLYGRERDIEAIQGLVASAQLVTLTGAGGVGKTRLALAAAQSLLPTFTDGVWFADFAPIDDEQLIPAVIARIFNLSESLDCSVLDALARVLHDKHTLLVLDNCEHFAKRIKELAERILSASNHVHMLATSRQPLRVDGERMYRVAPLERDAAFALCVERAQHVSDTFTLSNENREAVERIVHRLDGIPLAIELAAARLRVLTPVELEERLSERFRVLADPSKGVLPRHQTMRATLDWSYESLEPLEQLLFRRLAVFPASFSLDAVNRVCTDERIDEWNVIDALGSLVDKSLVTRTVAGGAQRYRLLENMRAYANEKAAAQGPSDLFHDRHAAYYAALAVRAESDRRHETSTAAWAHALEPELENFRSALHWTVDASHDFPLGARMLSALYSFWMFEGLAMESVRRTRTALEARDKLPPAALAAMFLLLARLYHDFPMTSQQMLDAASRAVALYETLDEEGGAAASLRELGIAQMRLGLLEESHASLQRALELAHAAGDVELGGRVSASLAFLLRAQGKPREARSEMLEVLKTVHDSGDERLVTITTMTIGELDFEIGDIGAAVERAKAILANHETMRKNADLRATEQANLAAYLFALGRRDEARATALDALAHSRYPAIPLQHFAAITAIDDPVRAAKLLGYVERAHEEAAFTKETPEHYTYERLLDAVETLLTPTEVEGYRRAGSAMTEDQARRLALGGTHARRHP